MPCAHPSLFAEYCREVGGARGFLAGLGIPGTLIGHLEAERPLWSPSNHPIGHESLVLGPHAPRRIFDVTLDLQLVEPLFRGELSI